MFLVVTTLSTRSEAQRFARRLVASGLAACVHLSPISSTYRWKGKMRVEREYELRVHCARVRLVMEWIAGHHPYECPMIYAVRPSATDGEYDKWVERHD